MRLGAKGRVILCGAGPIHKWPTEAVVLLRLNPAEPAKIPPPKVTGAKLYASDFRATDLPNCVQSP